MWPPGRWPARVVEFRRGPAAGPAGDGHGVVQGCPKPDLGGWTGRRGSRRRPLAAHPGGGHSGACSGKVGRTAAQQGEG
jgi:hypothetical protein